MMVRPVVSTSNTAQNTGEEPPVSRTFLWSWCVSLIPILIGLHAVGFWGRGIVDREARAFILNYLADRPLGAILFDPSLNDWGAYQARELSYLVDYFDAQILAGLYSQGMLLFIPASGALGLALFMAVYSAGAIRLLRLDRVSTAMLLSLFLSSMVVQASSAIFYRSAKILVSLLLLTFLFQTISLVQIDRTRRPAVWMFALLFFVGLGMVLSDRQGLFFLLFFLSLYVLWVVASPRSFRPHPQTSLSISGTCVAAVLVGTVYNQVIAPSLIRNLNGYDPDFSYQNLNLENLWSIIPWQQAGQMFLHQAELWCGNVPLWALTALLPAACWWYRKNTMDKRGVVRDALVTLATVGGLLLMIALMIIRHPAVYTIPDHSYWYYFLPIHVVFLLGFSLLCSRLAIHQSKWRIGVWLATGILVGLNMSHYSTYRNVMLESSWFSEQAAYTERTFDKYDRLQSQDDQSVRRWVTAEQFGGVLRLPVPAEDYFPDSLDVALATKSGVGALAHAGGMQWPLLRTFFDRNTSPLNDLSQSSAALAAWRDNGIRQVIVELDRYADATRGQAVVEAIRSSSEQIIGETQRGSVIQFVLADSVPLHRETQTLRLVSDKDFQLSASHNAHSLPRLLDGDVNTEWSTAQRQDGNEWLTLVFDRATDVARIRLDMHRRSFGDYPRTLRIESSSNQGDSVLYEGSGLVPLVRGVLHDNFLRSAIELDFTTNYTKKLQIQQTGQTVETPWSVYEVRVWKR